MSNFDVFYIEKSLICDVQVVSLIEKYKPKHVITCDHYKEIFNRKSQNFRLQKRKPALILASKKGELVFPVPPKFGIGSQYNYYFSHVLNCIFDCRYCYLQGMYESAHYVLFLNFEDFKNSIKRLIKQHENESITFFTGYEGDSLALDSVTQFVNNFYSLFKQYPSVYWELRTKSTYTYPLLKLPSLDNVIIAYSLLPEKISFSLDYKTPSIEKRIQCMEALQKRSWNLGIRFDPLIYVDNFQTFYTDLFKTVFSRLNKDQIHSITLGPFRMPGKAFDKVKKMYPEEPWFATKLTKRDKWVSYNPVDEEELYDFCYQEIEKYIDIGKIFSFEF